MHDAALRAIVAWVYYHVFHRFVLCRRVHLVATGLRGYGQGREVGREKTDHNDHKTLCQFEVVKIWNSDRMMAGKVAKLAIGSNLRTKSCEYLCVRVRG